MDGNLLVNSTFISSFKINKVNNLPSLTVFFCLCVCFVFSLIFLPSLSITFVVTYQAKLINKSSKLSVAKGIARSAVVFITQLVSDISYNT